MTRYAKLTVVSEPHTNPKDSMTLPEFAINAGYTVISNNSPTCCEISGDGDWKRLEKSCHRFVRASHQGHPVDHVTIVVRHGDNTRDLRDVGTGGTRWGKLPSVGDVPVHRGCLLY